MQAITAGMTGAQFLAALNSLRKEYNVEYYGAVHNGITDDTAAIQAAINAAVAAGGGTVYFPNGVYIIAGPLVRDAGSGIDPKSQLYIPPYVGATITNVLAITLRGESPPQILAAIGGINVVSPTNYGSSNGVVLRSTLINDVEDAFILGSKGPTGTYGSFNYNQCYIFDINFQTTPNAQKAVTIGGIGFKDQGQTIIERCTIAAYNLVGNQSILPINNCTGIALGANFDNQINIVRDTTVMGFVNGYFLADHGFLEQTDAMVCLNGYVFGMNKMIARAGNIEAQWCKNSIKIIDDDASGLPRTIHVKCLNVENTADGYWYDKAYHVLDAANLGRGEIHYDLNEDVRPGFTKSGGTGIMCSPISPGKVTSGTDTGVTAFTISGSRGGNAALASLITKLCAKFGFVDSTS